MSDTDRVINVIRDMLVELDADPRKAFSIDKLADVLGDEEAIRCVAATDRGLAALAADLEARGISYWGQDEPGVAAYEAEREWRVRDCQTLFSHIETAERNMASMSDAEICKPNTGGTSLDDRMMSWHQQLKGHIKWLKACYERLDERERLFFSPPVPNATRCDQMPRPAYSYVGILWPERTPQQRAQKAALEAELSRLEQEIESGT